MLVSKQEEIDFHHTESKEEAKAIDAIIYTIELSTRKNWRRVLAAFLLRNARGFLLADLTKLRKEAENVK